MKKVTAYGLLCLSFTISLSQSVKAEVADARAVGLGGTTIGEANGAFSPLRNPAGMVDIGWGSFILPLSPTVIVGNSLGNFSSFIPTNSSDYTKAILDNFSKSTGTVRIESAPVIPLIGFSGSPFPLKVMGKPVAFGINLWGKLAVSANVGFSSGITSLINNSSTLFSSINDLQKNGLSATSKFSEIATNVKIPNLNNLADISGVITDAENLQKNTLQPAILLGDQVINSFDKFNTDLNNILPKLEDLTKNTQNGKGDVVADGHAVIAVSAASRVFKNDLVDLSVGANLKGFFFPYNQPSSSVTAQNAMLSTFIGGQNVLPVNVSTDFKLGPFQSITEMQKVLNEQISPLITDGKSFLTTAKDLDQKLSEAIPKAKVNALSVISDLPGIQSTATTLQSQITSLNQKVTTDSTQKLLSGFENTIKSDLKDVKIDTKQITDVSSFGFGVDLGIQARVMDDILVGLVLENPIVLWPAKSKTNQITFDTNQISFAGGKSIDPAKLLQIATDNNPQSANYNLSEPFALRFGGSYKFDKYSPYTKHLTVLADVEQVFNGRPFAAHIGVEKGWMFGSAGVFVRLGGQLGGLGSMATIGLGFKGGPFHIDLGYGANNPFNPLASTNAVAALSTSLSF